MTENKNKNKNENDLKRVGLRLYRDERLILERLAKEGRLSQSRVIGGFLRTHSIAARILRTEAAKSAK